MSHTAAKIVSYFVDGQQVSTSTFTYTADDQNNLSTVVPPHTTNFLSSFNITLSALRSMCMISDESLTVKTNSSSAPQETISLVAGKPLTWDTDESYPEPFAGNVTALYLTNSGALSANFNFWSLSQQ